MYGIVCLNPEDTVTVLLLHPLTLSKIDLINSGPHRNLNITDK